MIDGLDIDIQKLNTIEQKDKKQKEELINYKIKLQQVFYLFFPTKYFIIILCYLGQGRSTTGRWVPWL